MFGTIKKVRRTFLARKREQYLKDLIRKGLRIGQNVEIIDEFFFDPSHCFLISIGDNCTLAPNVRLIAHDASCKKLLGYTKLGKIEIGENCFLGDSVIVLPGVTIGSNSIIGAGSVVTRSIPPGKVAAGNPARVLFSVEEYAEKVQRLQADKQVFGPEYYIEHLDTNRRAEILASVGNGIGFIV